MKIAIVATVFVAGLSAQGLPRPFEPGVSEGLRQYLDLTGEQVTTINRLNAELQRYNAEKSRRVLQIQLELSQETHRETLDAMALGVRHLELEVIRREQEAERRRLAAEIDKLFTPAQRPRLAALQEVLRTYATACEAVDRNLLPAPGIIQREPLPGIVRNDGSGIASFILGPLPCGGVGSVRTGDFVFTPGIGSGSVR